MKEIIVLCLLACLTSCKDKEDFQTMRERINLSGSWDSSLGSCTLPGTTDENKLGNGKHPTHVTSQLTRIYPYSGIVEYEKEVEIPSQMEGKRLTLFMERTKPSTLWIDGDSIGTLGHIYAPHCYILPALTSGNHHIKIRIDNSATSVPSEIQGSHAWTDGTQTNWNGILGDFYIEATPQTYLSQVQVYPSVEEKKARVNVSIYSTANQSGVVTLAAKAWNTNQKHRLQNVEKEVSLNKGENKIELVLDMGDRMQTWSEFHPALYALNVTLATNEGIDNMVTDFGMRHFTTEKTQFSINGFKTFLRGKHDACVFPLTGYAPMDVKSWQKVFQIAKSYGINYYRCHSYTPPRAAFVAADIEGIYFQPELPLWGAISPDNHRLNEFLQNEAYMTLDYLGNHPSFTMLSLGNELGGDLDLMRSWLKGFREHDNRHLYSFGSNNFLGWGGAQEGEDFLTTCRVGGGEGYTTHVRSSFAFVDAEQGGLLNNTRPNTRADYAVAIAKSPRPVISHETGQFQIYPDYKEITKYTGVLHPYNLEIFRDRLNENGLQNQIDAFHQASGRFAIECYKADIEYGLRTAGLGGFQMLDLQDFPGQGTALVGILDAFMDSKGIVTPETFRGFCGPVVPLALMDTYCYSNKAELNIGLALSNYEENAWSDALCWRLESLNDNVNFVREGKVEAHVEQGKVMQVGELKSALTEIDKPTQLRLTLTTGNYHNYYNLWVYPDRTPESNEGIFTCQSLDAEAKKILEKGGKVLLIPDHKAIEKQSVGGLFTPDYWNYAMFKSISENAGREVSPGTLSLLMNEKHPLFRQFPTECHSNWQWWSIVRNARPLILNATRHEYKPLIQVVDNVERNHKLGLLFEFAVDKGKVLVCMSNLEAIRNTPEGQQFSNAILSYMKSGEFSPTERLTSQQLHQILTSDVKKNEIVGVKNQSDYDVQPK